MRLRHPERGLPAASGNDRRCDFNCRAAVDQEPDEVTRSGDEADPQGQPVVETAICIIDDTGAIVRELRASSDPESLILAFDGVGLPMMRIGLEACSQSAWLHQGMARAGLPVVCIETREAKAAMGAMPNKTDRNDARGLAQIIRTGWYRQAHVKSAPSRMACSLLMARRAVLCKVRDMENAVRAVLQ